MLTGLLGKGAVAILVLLAVAFLGLKNYKGGHLADALMNESDENDEEILERLIRQDAEATANKLGVSPMEAENAIRQQWDEGRLQIRDGFLRPR
jgi:hypothetical protein